MASKRLPPEVAARLAKRRGTAELRRIAREMQAPFPADKQPGCARCKTIFACTAAGRCKHPIEAKDRQLSLLNT